MEGILVDVLLIDDFMESVRPMSTEENESHNLHREKQQSLHVWTQEIAVPITKPRYFETVIPLQAIADLEFDRGSPAKSYKFIRISKRR